MKQAQFSVGDCVPVKARRTPPAREEAENLLPEQQRLLNSLDLSSNRVLSRIERLIDDAIADSKASPPRSHVIIIRAPWGYGKTMFGKEFVRRVVESRGAGYRYVTLENVIEKIIDSVIDYMQSRPSMRYEGIDYLSSQAARAELARLFEEALQQGKPSFLFIDEVEAILEAAQHSGSSKNLAAALRPVAARALLNELLAALRVLLHSGAEGPYARASGKLHIIMAATPEAYNTIMVQAQKMGIGGRLARRIDVVSLTPLSKTDTYKVVRALLSGYYGLDDAAWSPRLANMVHAVAGGNPGLTIRLVNSLLRESTILCREERGEACICSLRSPVLVTRLLAQIELPYTPQGGLERAVKRDIADLALDAARDGNTGLAEMVAFLSPVSEEESRGYEVVLSYHGVRLMPVILYRGDCGQVSLLLDQAARTLAQRTGTALSDARPAVEELLVIEEDGCAVAVPADQNDYSEVALLLAGHGVRASSQDIAAVVREIDSAAYSGGVERAEAFMVKPSSLPVLYPPAAIRTLPFMHDPEAAARLYNEVIRLRHENPRDFARLTALGLRGLLELKEAWEQGLAGEAATEINLTIGGVVYSIKALIEYYEQGVPIYSVNRASLDKNKPIVLVRISVPPSVRLPKPLSKSWAAIDLGLTPRDAETLAAVGLVLSRQDSGLRSSVDRMVLEEMAAKYRRVIEESADEAAKQFRERGIAVPPVLYSPRGDIREIPNAYRLLLFAARYNGVLRLDEAAQLLYQAYRVRPYKGRGRKWCDTDVPSVVILDLEPDDHRAYYDDARRAKYIEQLKEKLRDMASMAARNGLAEQKGPDVYLLTQHPVEERLAKLQQSLGGTAGRDRLAEYFLLPAEPASREAARQVLDVLIQISQARREAARVPSPAEARGFQEIAGSAHNAAREPARCLPEGLGAAAYLAILKERGAKLVSADIVADTAMNFAGELRRHPLLAEMRPLLAKYAEMLHAAKQRAEEEVKEQLRRLNETKTALKQLLSELSSLGIQAKLGPGISSILDEKNLCQKTRKAAKEAEELLNQLMKRRPDEATRQGYLPAELARALRYDECSNPYGFAPILYYLDRALKRENNLPAAASLVAEAGKLVDEVKARLEALPAEARNEAKKILAAYKQLIIDLDGEFISTLRHIRNNIGELEKLHATCTNLRNKARNTASNIEANTARTAIELEDLRNSAERLRRAAEATGAHRISEEATRIAAEAARIQEEIDDITNTAKELLEKIEETPCSNTNAVTLLESNIDQLRRLETQILNYQKETQRLKQRLKEAQEKLKEIIEDRIVPLDRLAEKIKKLKEHINDIKAAATATRALGEYQQITTKIRSIANLSQEPPENLNMELQKAKEALDRAYHAVKEAIVSDIGETGHQLLEKIISGEIQPTRLHKTIDEAANKLNKKQQQILETLYMLDKKGYIEINLKF